ncbi:DegT/DnrJ/EryC1/StrS aminotransferase family protein [Paludicola sp. MB14-C6]|uniref:DegT/DnrJ/EryC1/StrS family aminotransferase n=1 Tax=Paludihabitans sp. MB14-C6 TaxID=3070656 RepID=UPI0027DE37F6|nr:DegT/DnrJ/EryC1/StrS aminotransferase family protein [Paludicola sp. MB14-C6]WMJ22058.1 DegT/DnrJ/EryC1/StrS aminotransferase family protein [Paludicola sp. MB14-C6]
MSNYQIPFSPPDITDIEINEVIDTLKSGWITTGPKTKLFEQKIADYCGATKAACLNSATAALELTLHILGIGEGDEVITSAYTYTASASVICHVGATPVLVDVAKDSFQMDYTKLKEAITPKTKAIIPVDIAGVVCDYDTIFSIVKEKADLFTGNSDTAKQIARIAVIADAAHSFGASQNGKHAGSIADFTCFSFHAVKNLTTAEGGAAVFSNTDSKNVDDIYKQYMLLSLHGQSKDALAKTQLGAWEYDIVSPAYKCNMTDIMASLGLGQLQRYDGMLARRKEMITRYNKAFEGTIVKPLTHYDENNASSGHLYVTRLMGKDISFRNNIIIELAKRGISANVHYKPLPLLSAYKNIGFDIQNYPNAFELYQNEITLPLHTKLTDDEIDYVTATLLELLK